MQIIYLHTGSNMGNRLSNLSEVNNRIEQKIGQIKKISSIYETSAWGETAQASFLNQALEVSTLLSPEAVLEQIHKIEKTMGRIRKKKWSERLIDIDILFYGNEIIRSKHLIIPHEHLHKRNFVLIPLNEIIPDFTHPIFEKSIKMLLEDCSDDLAVKKEAHF